MKMQFLKRKEIPSCHKHGTSQEAGGRYAWLKWILPLAGLASLIWFLIRVIPKPSRALYPCQRVAFPMASGFIAWLVGLGASAAIFRKARLNLSRRRYLVGLVFLALSVSALWITLSATSENSAVAEPQPGQAVNL